MGVETLDLGRDNPGPLTELKDSGYGMIGVAVQTVRPDKRRVYPELAEGIRGKVRIVGESPKICQKAIR